MNDNKQLGPEPDRMQWTLTLPRPPRLTRLRRVWRFVKSKLFGKLRVNIMLTFGVCTIAGLIAYGITNPLFSRVNYSATIDYTASMRDIDMEARNKVTEIQSNNTLPENHRRTVEEILNGGPSYMEGASFIIDLEGKVLYRSEGAFETQVDLRSLVKTAMDVRANNGQSWQPYFADGAALPPSGTFVTFYPVDVGQQKGFLVARAVPNSVIEYTEHDSPLSVLAAIVVFLLLFIWISKRKMREFTDIAVGLREIAKGNLAYRLQPKSHDELGQVAANINHMAGELERKIEEERRAESTKNELITNVSHDLRTPLTSVMGYLRLLKDKKYETEHQQDDYVDIAFQKSERIKSLLEDLFEYTKLTSHNIPVLRESVRLNELLQQLIDELSPAAEEHGVTLQAQFPDERIMVYIDPEKMVRVFENLLINAIHYSTSPGEINIVVELEEDTVRICFANQGESIPQEALPRLFERFYRVEASRSSQSGGSGLGLAIAKSIVDLHGGEIWAECEGEQIRFNVRLKR